MAELVVDWNSGHTVLLIARECEQCRYHREVGALSIPNNPLSTSTVDNVANDSLDCIISLARTEPPLFLCAIVQLDWIVFVFNSVLGFVHWVMGSTFLIHYTHIYSCISSLSCLECLYSWLNVSDD